MSEFESDIPGGIDGRRLEALVEQCIGFYEDGDLAAIDELLDGDPAAAPRVRARIEALAEHGLLETSRQEPRVPDRLAQFRIVRPLGRGGMGAVYLARDEELDRDVAVKVLLGPYLMLPDARRRFRREVEMVARLQHPGIVTVHAFGEDEGLPWFAMDHVPGLSLAAALARLRESAPEEIDGGDLARQLDCDCAMLSGEWWRVVARVVGLAAEALVHAHSRGVIHRDIKPSNIMITPEGRVVLLDFGLAVADTATRITMNGAMVGSVPYMAPEQVRGETSAIDERTDVYGLGVTLYELLTLRNPFLTPSLEATRARVLEGLPSRVRAHNRAIPADLEAVCLEAMEADSRRRYPSAAALRADIEAVLEGRPIAARRPSVFGRTRRWARRHPARALAAFLAFIVVVVGPLTVAALERRSTRKITRAFEETRRLQRETAEQREMAMRAYDRSRDLVDRLLVRLADGRLMLDPGHQELREWMLEEAYAAYSGLAQERTDDPRMQVAVADAARRLARIAGEQGRIAVAIDGLERALAEGRRLETAVGGDHKPLVLQADCLHGLVHLYAVQGRAPEALAAARSRIEVWERILGRDPADVGSAVELAHALRDHAAHALIASETESARKGFLRCKETWVDIVARRPTDGHRRSLVMITAELAYIRYRLGDVADVNAVELLEDAIAAIERVRKEEGADYFRDRDLGKYCTMAGQEQAKAGNREAALRHMLRGVEVHRGLVATFPLDLSTRHMTALNEFGVALHLHADERYAEAATYYLAAIANREKVVAGVPDDPGHALGLAATEKSLGAALSRDARWSDAAVHLVRATVIFDAVPRSALHPAAAGIGERARVELLELMDLAPAEALLGAARALVRSGEAREAEREEAFGWAVRLLGAALRKDIEKPERIEDDDAFKPLRGRPAYQSVLNRL